MNQAQLTSLVKQGLNSLAGILAAHGYASAGTVLNTQTVASALVIAGLWIYSHFFQHTDKNEATPTPMKDGSVLPPVATLLLIVVLSGALMVGCAGQSKRLEAGGAYAPTGLVVSTNGFGDLVTNSLPTQLPDFELYAADSTFDLAYSAIGAAFKIERDNRAFLWSVSHDIKHSLDAIRPDAAKAVVAYTAARDAYVKNPNPVNLAGLQLALSEIQRLSASASAVVAVIKINK